ncbi:MAG: hypothetical protein ACR2N9_05400 [Acidimicrobiia bacterium]
MTRQIVPLSGDAAFTIPDIGHAVVAAGTVGDPARRSEFACETLVAKLAGSIPFIVGESF